MRRPSEGKRRRRRKQAPRVTGARRNQIKIPEYLKRFPERGGVKDLVRDAE